MKQEITTNKKTRYLWVDIFRIAFCLLVIFYHLTLEIHLENAKYSMMLFFFILSGYSLTYVYQGKDLVNQESGVKHFYLKRIVKMLPLYIIVEIFSLFAHYDQILFRLEIFPLRLLGLQVALNEFDLFIGITWFTSCIFICYLVYPLINHFINKMNKKNNIIIFIILLLIYIYINVLSIHLEIDIYYNLFVRILEFAIGCYAASIFISDYNFNTYIKILFMIITIGLFVSLFFDMGGYVNLIKIIFTIAIVVLSYFIKFTYLDNNHIVSKIITFISSLTLELFLLQDVFFSGIILNPIKDGVSNHSLYLFTMFSLLFISSVIIHFVFTKPISKYLSKILIKPSNIPDNLKA